MEMSELELGKDYAVICATHGLKLVKQVFSSNLMWEREWIFVIKKTRKTVSAIKLMKLLLVRKNFADF